MQLQERPYSCGAAALRSVLHLLGHNISEKVLRQRASTTPEDGTNEHGIIEALKYYGYAPKQYTFNNSTDAWNFLREKANAGRPVLLCVDKWSHWISSIGIIGTSLLIFDPRNGGKKRKKYSGLIPVDKETLTKRWAFYNVEEELEQYYCIVVY